MFMRYFDIACGTVAGIGVALLVGTAIYMGVMLTFGLEYFVEPPRTIWAGIAFITAGLIAAIAGHLIDGSLD